MIESESRRLLNLSQEGVFALVYFLIYLGYLFTNRENEFEHWITLVCVPLILIVLFQKRTTGYFSFQNTFASVGLEIKRWKVGLVWAAIFGLLLSSLQLFFSRQSDELLQILKSGAVSYLLPLAFILLFLTAGFTEEFFFRGILQTRLAALFKSNLWAVLLASILFGLYHLPYAYFNPNWPSHGNWLAAFQSALGQGVPGGLILGTIYVRSKQNLITCVVVHSLINLFPAMLLIKSKFF